MAEESACYQVSIWLGFDMGDPEVDILKTNCGVEYYDLDHQEVIGDFEKLQQQPIAALTEKLSYADSFAAAVGEAAVARNIHQALYIIAQYHFDYEQEELLKDPDPDPVFLGVFEYRT